MCLNAWEGELSWTLGLTCTGPVRPPAVPRNLNARAVKDMSALTHPEKYPPLMRGGVASNSENSDGLPGIPGGSLGVEAWFSGTLRGSIRAWIPGMVSPKRRNPTGKARRRRAQNPVRWLMLDLNSGASPNGSEVGIGLSHQVNSWTAFTGLEETSNLPGLHKWHQRGP